MKSWLSRLLDFKSEMKKKGAMEMNAVVTAIIGIVLVVVLITAIAPTVFLNSTTISGAPSFFNIIYPIMIAIALILLLWRAISAR